MSGRWAVIMQERDTVDRTIRNQRQRGWHILVWLCIWGLAWMGSAIALERAYSPPSYVNVLAWIAWVVLMLATYIFILIRIGRLPPKRVKLGDDLWIVPGPTVRVKDIRGFHFERDPDEDYVESKLPIPCCRLTIELAKRKVQMIVTLGDASRVHEWAEQHGVAVFDPEGYACRGDGR